MCINCGRQLEPDLYPSKSSDRTLFLPASQACERVRDSNVAGSPSLVLSLLVPKRKFRRQDQTKYQGSWLTNVAVLLQHASLSPWSWAPYACQSKASSTKSGAWPIMSSESSSRRSEEPGILSYELLAQSCALQGSIQAACPPHPAARSNSSARPNDDLMLMEASA